MYLVMLASCFVGVFTSLAYAQQKQDSVCVTEAVAPVFPPTIVALNQQGTFNVMVQINKDGVVKSVDAGRVPKTLKPVLELVASRWRFNSSEDDKYRNVTLSFVFTLVPTATLSEDLLPVFRPPYQIEVKARRPSIEGYPGSLGKKH